MHYQCRGSWFKLLMFKAEFWNIFYIDHKKRFSPAPVEVASTPERTSSSSKHEINSFHPFLWAHFGLPGSLFPDASESGKMALALESMCYVDVWRQVAVPALNVTSLCGGPTSGSSSSRMPSSTRRWTSVAEYSRQGQGSGIRNSLGIFFRDPELLDADPNSSLKWLWSLNVDSTVL